MSKNYLGSSKKSLRSLDRLNFFLADVRDGVGPYLAIYLQASHKWNPANIGIAMSAMGIATVVAQTPAGAVVDRLRQKRLLVVVAAGCASCGRLHRHGAVTNTTYSRLGTSFNWCSSRHFSPSYSSNYARNRRI
ncbi:MFS transporter [Scytonema millei]|uniref:MFS transporter n=1 Tax=Scytonema millei TaxID=1245922 RepID=UPI0025727773|nr:MFS transporter [Scytonema millei]